MSGSGAPPRASTSVNPDTGESSVFPVTENDTACAGRASPRPPVSAYGVALSVYAPSGRNPPK